MSRMWGLLVALTSACALPSGATAEDPARLLRGVGFEGKLEAEPPLTAAFREADGRAVTLADALGDGPAILVMAYYRCRNLCSVILANLAASLGKAELDADEPIDVIVVSIDPSDDPALATDTETKLFAMQAEPTGTRWHFLSGDGSASRAVAEAIGFRYRYDERTNQYAHAAGIAMLSPEGRAARYFYGVTFEPRDLALGLVETANGKIGTAADRLLLLCYHYDPTTGRYGLAIRNVVRGAGAATAVLILLGLITLLRAERERPGGRR